MPSALPSRPKAANEVRRTLDARKVASTAVRHFAAGDTRKRVEQLLKHHVLDIRLPMSESLIEHSCELGD